MKCKLVLTVIMLSLWIFIRAISINPTIKVDHPYILTNEKQTIYILVQFQIPEIEENLNNPRPKLNLGLVLDRSGSMSGKGKLDYAKKASNILINTLKPSDRIAVVEYDELITVIWPSSPVESPEMIKACINNLSPRGSTNLTGGMMKGADEIQKYISKDFINRVILLSDGLANEGVTNPIEIKRLVKEAKNKGIHISTMGLGLDYDEDLMQAISENGGGNYYFIESPNQMVRIFQEEMSILFTTVAKDININFIAKNEVKKIEVFGFTSDTNGRQTTIEQEDFYSGENRTLLIRLEIEPKKTGTLNLGKFQMNYIDVKNKSKKTFDKTISVIATSNLLEVTGKQNKDVIVEATLIEADKKHEDYIRMYEKGDKKIALENIKDLENKLTIQNEVFSDVIISKKIEALKMETQEMKEAEENSFARLTYLKSNKQRLYKSKKGKRGQYILQEGNSGIEVEKLQTALKNKGFYSGLIDGKFTENVKEAVINFQKNENLTPDGVVGPLTLKALGIY
ncbi:MAG: VWA domain-containing protein [Candidatus Cloacimonetes bacterium]|nr:VWA domain-containing protein [Candidatus Cloacimonadota bacterium]